MVKLIIVRITLLYKYINNNIINSLVGIIS